MARRGAQPPPEEEPVEETEAMEAEAAEEEAAPAATEFVPEQTHKPKSDVYTLILILTFVAFLTGCVVAGREAWENYDVQFWVFTKQPGKQVEEQAPPSGGGAATSTSEPTPPPAAPK